jgi:hypothetical protein
MRLLSNLTLRRPPVEQAWLDGAFAAAPATLADQLRLAGRGIGADDHMITEPSAGGASLPFETFAEPSEMIHPPIHWVSKSRC